MRRTIFAALTAALALLPLAAVPARAGDADAMTPEEKEIYQKQSRRLAGRHEAARAAAAAALGGLGPKASGAVGLLVSRLNGDPNEGVRCACADALGQIRVASSAVVRSLGNAVAGGSDSLKISAAVALSKLGREADDAIGPLVSALAHENASVRRAAALGLGTTTPRADETKKADAKVRDKVLERLKKALEDADAGVKAEAAVAIVRIGAGDASVVPPIEALLSNRRESLDVRTRAAESLGALGAGAKAAVPALSAAVRETPDINPALPFAGEEKKAHFAFRAAAARALGQMGKAAAEAAPALEAAANAGDQGLREAAEAALAAIR